MLKAIRKTLMFRYVSSIFFMNGCFFQRKNHSTSNRIKFTIRSFVISCEHAVRKDFVKDPVNHVKIFKNAM